MQESNERIVPHLWWRGEFASNPEFEVTVTCSGSRVQSFFCFYPDEKTVLTALLFRVLCLSGLPMLDPGLADWKAEDSLGAHYVGFEHADGPFRKTKICE